MASTCGECSPQTSPTVFTTMLDYRPNSSGSKACWRAGLCVNCGMHESTFHALVAGIVASTRLVMATNRKPWRSGELLHDLVAVANEWLRTFSPTSDERRARSQLGRSSQI